MKTARPQRLWGLIRLRAKTTVSKTILSMFLPTGMHRLLYGLVDLLLAHSGRLLTHRGKEVVQLLQPRGSRRGLGDAHRPDPQLPFSQHHLEHGVLGDTE